MTVSCRGSSAGRRQPSYRSCDLARRIVRSGDEAHRRAQADSAVNARKVQARDSRLTGPAQHRVAIDGGYLAAEHVGKERQLGDIDTETCPGNDVVNVESSAFRAVNQQAHAAPVRHRSPRMMCREYLNNALDAIPEPP